jgi:dolichol-phosphate mannosyltransferase
MRFSVVVPVYNEAGNILPLIEEMRLALTRAGDYEVLVVDDGSDDATARILAGARGRYSRLRVLRHEHRSGQSAALLSGVRAAYTDLVVTLDGDGQNDPLDISRLLDTYQAAGDPNLLVAGQRTERRDGIEKRWSSRIANAVRGRLLGDETPDTGCGIKVFSRDLYLSLPTFDHMHRFLPALVKSAGGRVQSIPVNHRARMRGRSKYGIHNRLWAGLLDLFGVMWLQRRAETPAAAPDNVWQRLYEQAGRHWLTWRAFHADALEDY